MFHTSGGKKNESESATHIPDESGIDVDVIDLSNPGSGDVAEALNKIVSVVDLTDLIDVQELAKEKHHKHQSPSKSPSVIVINMVSPDRNGSPAEHKSAIKNRLRKLLAIKKLAKDEDHKSKKSIKMKASPVNQYTPHKPCTCDWTTCIKLNY